VWLYIALSVFAFHHTPLQTEPDTAQYQMVAEWPIVSADYWLDWRPTFTPLLFKLLGNHALAITWAQLLLGMAAWIAFAGGVAAHTRHWAFKIGGFAASLGLGLATDYSLVYRALLTEGVAYSLFTAVVAAWLWALVYWRRHPHLGRAAQIRLGLALWLIMSLWTVSRYTNTFALAAYAGLLACLWLWTQRGRSWAQFRYTLPIVFLGAIIPFVFESQPVSRSDYWKQGLMNALAEKVLPYPERRDFLIERGMPSSPEALAFAGYVPARYYADWNAVYGDWLVHGTARRSYYIDYLVLHPLPRLQELLGQWRLILNPDIQAWALSRDSAQQSLLKWQTDLHYLYYDPSALGYLLLGGGALALVLGLAWHQRQWPAHFWLPIALLVVALPLAYLIWFGDAYYERVFIGVGQQHKMAVVMLAVWGMDWAWRVRPQVNPMGRGVLSTCLSLLALLAVWEAGAGFAVLRTHITYPLLQRLLPNTNLLSEWGISDDEYHAYQVAPLDQMVLNVQFERYNGDPYLREFWMHWAEKGAWAELRRDSDPNQVELSWRNHPAPYGPGVSPAGPAFGGYPIPADRAQALLAWQNSRLPANLSAAGIQFVQVESEALSYLPAYQQRVLQNPALYEPVRTWEGQTLYAVIGTARAWEDSLPADAPYGLDPDLWAAYMAYTPRWVDSEAVILNPATPTDERTVILNTLRYAPPPPADQANFWELLSLLEQQVYGDTLPNQNALSAWRESKEAALLAQAGADYLLVTELWRSWLSDAELAQLDDPTQYELVMTWAGDLPRRYWLYRLPGESLLQ
jgi:hypothetical protein